MKNIALKFIWALSLFTFLASCNQPINFNNVDEMVDKAQITTLGISADELDQKIDNGDMILLIDVREPNEYNAGYIPGAINIARGILEFNISNDKFWEEAMLYMPEKDEEIIIYCRKGKRSILAAQTLQQLGFTNVKYIIDGWKKWEMTFPDKFEKNLDQLGHDDGGETGGC